MSPSLSEGKRHHIVVIEDNRADIYLIQEALNDAGIRATVEIVQDGERAIQFFDRLDRDPSLPCPSLLLLDINLPRRPGSEVLAHVRRSGRCAQTRVVVVTSSDSDRDREEMGKLGVIGYFRKPSDYATFMKLGEMVRALLEPSE